MLRSAWLPLPAVYRHSRASSPARAPPDTPLKHRLRAHNPDISRRHIHTCAQSHAPATPTPRVRTFHPRQCAQDTTARRRGTPCTPPTTASPHFSPPTEPEAQARSLLPHPNAPQSHAPARPPPHRPPLPARHSPPSSTTTSPETSHSPPSPRATTSPSANCSPSSNLPKHLPSSTPSPPPPPDTPTVSPLSRAQEPSRASPNSPPTTPT